ncbi:o-methyltransferase [Penicillium malachiteum]|uniref:O-methyltransferase n=1 Tax=Penicillium malachiteum TaxID=1324776 RepID=A0AAD6MX17_9EURO|nr:o-methyltransferase [Penicillium malachiteum]
MTVTETNGTNGANGHQEAFVDMIADIATSPNIPAQVPGLLEKIAKSGKAFLADDPKARTELLDAARALVYATETPREAMIRVCWSQSTLYACIESGVDMGLFTALSKDDKPKSVASLAEVVGAEPKMLARLMKHLCAMGVIIETGPDEYLRTGYSISLMAERFSDAYPCITDSITKGIMALPAHLKKTNYRNPTNGVDCAFQAGYDTKEHFFEFLGSHPMAAKQFNNHMSAYHQGRPSWMDVGFFDVPRLTNVDMGEDGALIVDMGGSLGHDLSEFRRKWPQAAGRFILQDLPAVVKQAQSMDLHKSIETMVHDFFTEQPVKGARVYYMHSILHDWPDEKCIEILKNIVPAMKPGFSKILINENVIPETNAYWETTSLDIIMMSDFASCERTVTNWHSLVEAAGLKIRKIWTVERGVESLIECELAE